MSLLTEVACKSASHAALLAAIGCFSENGIVTNDFFYEGYWTELQRRGWLHLDTAFSRDQEEKIYVQHRIRERGRELAATKETLSSRCVLKS